MTFKTKWRYNVENSKIEKYFNQKINQRKPCSKKVSKYVSAFDYIDKTLIVLSGISGWTCIISSVNVVGTPIGIARASFTFLTTVLSLTTGIIKNLLSIEETKRKSMIISLCCLKVNWISLSF